MLLPNGIAKAQLAMDFYSQNSDIYFRNQTGSVWRPWRLLSNDLKTFVFTTTPQSSTAGSLINAGTLSTITGGLITDKEKVKGLSIIYAYGDTSNDISVQVLIYHNNEIQIKPSVTQNSFRARISILY